MAEAALAALQEPHDDEEAGRGGRRLQVEGGSDPPCAKRLHAVITAGIDAAATTASRASRQYVLTKSSRAAG